MLAMTVASRERRSFIAEVDQSPAVGRPRADLEIGVDVLALVVVREPFDGGIELREIGHGVGVLCGGDECVKFYRVATDLERKAIAFRLTVRLWSQNAKAFRSTV